DNAADRFGNDDAAADAASQLARFGRSGPFRRRREFELSPIGLGEARRDVVTAAIEPEKAVEILDRAIVIARGLVGHATGGERGGKIRAEFDGTVRIGNGEVELAHAAVCLRAAGQDVKGFRVQCEDAIEVLYGARMIALAMIAEAPNRKGGDIVWI